MKKFLTSLSLVLALGIAGLSSTALADWDDGYWNDYDTGVWEDDEWTTDDYGLYDNDFGWETDDEEWDSWYDDSESDWETYDDAGDEGWLDI